MIHFKFKHAATRIPFLVSVLFFIVFAIMTPTHNTGYGDSDEFLAVAKEWGVAHPPGYVVYTTLLHAATKLPLPYTTFAQRAHLLSGLLTAAALYLAGRTVIVLLRKLYANVAYIHILSVVVSVAVMLFLAGNQQLFLYALMAEKYVLSLFLLSWLLYLLVSSYFSDTMPRSQLVLTGIVTALLVSHHQSMVFILPFVGYIVWKKCKLALQSWLTIGAGFLAMSLVWLSLLYWRMQVAVEPTWQQDPGLVGLYQMVTRDSFRGLIIESNTQSNGYIPTFNSPDITNGVFHYLLSVGQWFYWIAIVPFGLGVYVIYSKHKQESIVLLAPFGLLGIILAGYLTWPTDIGSQAITARFYIPSIITTASILAIGLMAILSRFSKALTILGTRSQTATALFSTIILIVPLVSWGYTAAQSQVKSFPLVSIMYRSVLEEVEPHALVACFSDASCFAMLYEQSVNGVRPDVDVVPLAYPLINASLSTKSLERFDYEKNPYRLFDIISWNLDKRPVYAVDLSQFYVSFLGIDNGIMFYIPRGFYGQLTRQMPDTYPALTNPVRSLLTDVRVPEFDLMGRFFVYSAAQAHFSNAYFYLKTGERFMAQEALNRGVNIAYLLYDQEKKTALSERVQIEKIPEDERYDYGKSVPTAQFLKDLIPDLLERGQNSQAVYIARSTLLVDPLYVPGRLELAKMYIKMGDKEFAKKEFTNVLSIEPDNTDAAENLKNL